MLFAGLTNLTIGFWSSTFTLNNLLEELPTFAFDELSVQFICHWYVPLLNPDAVKLFAIPSITDVFVWLIVSFIIKLQFLIVLAISSAIYSKNKIPLVSLSPSIGDCKVTSGGVASAPIVRFLVSDLLKLKFPELIL